MVISSIGTRFAARCLVSLLAVLGSLATAGMAATSSAKAKDDFMPYVELAPFVVNGKQLAISVHARSTRDRRYAEQFAEEVVKVVYEGVTESTGKGLVIIGKKGEPHPVFVFRKFLALAKAGALDPAVAARAPELESMLHHWQGGVNSGKSFHIESDGDVDLEFEQLVLALPLPLEGLGAQLYQLAWRDEFDEARVEARLRALHPADLTGRELARFDWVFYLPPRGAFEQVLDGIIADAMKEDGAGFFARTMVKGVMLVVKPKIRQAIEGVRRGLLFSTVVRARAPYPEDELSALTGAYIEVQMPDAKPGPGSEHDRAVRAVRDMVREWEAKPKVAGERAEEPADEPSKETVAAPAER